MVARELREHIPQPKVMRDLNRDFPINPAPIPHPDVCRSVPKMSWMHYLVIISHFAKYGKNRPLIV